MQQRLAPKATFRNGMPKQSDRGQWRTQEQVLEGCVDLAVDCIHAMDAGTAELTHGPDGELLSVSWPSTDGSGADDDVWFVDPFDG